mgnify:CR=1 FL=1
MPMIREKQAEMEGVLAVAGAMAVAARTAPKARGVDAIETLIVHGKELEALSRAMIEHGKARKKEAIFARDAGNVLNSQAVVLIGLKDLGPKKPDKPLDCGACGHGDCAGFLKAERSEGDDFPGPVCAFQSIDLGVALASACALAARFHVDNRMMYTVGGPARKLNWMASGIIIGIPLSCSGKNIYFDRG